MTFYWNQISVKGGGYTMNIEPHPTVQDRLMARNDIGGFFLYQPTTKTWKLIGDFTNDNYWGGAAFAWHPTNTNTFIIACGKYARGGNISKRGGVFISTDLGQTLTQLNFPNIAFGSNENNQRFAPHRIRYCPSNPNIILFGVWSDTYAGASNIGDGLYRSVDGGVNWSFISNSSLAPGQTIPSINKNNGVTSIIFDPNNNAICYAAVWGVGVSRSTDYGATWSFIGGAKYIYDFDTYSTDLYSISLISSIAAGNGDNGYEGLSRYRSGSWSNIDGKNADWITINKFTGVITTGWHNDPFWFNRTQGGIKTTYRIDALFNFVQTTPWNDGLPFRTGQLFFCVYDPLNATGMFAGDEYSAWINRNYNVAGDTWIAYNTGLENTVFYTGKFLTGDRLISALYDIFVLQHDSGLETPPPQRIGGVSDPDNVRYPSGYDVALCRDNQNYIAVIGSTYSPVQSDVIGTVNGGAKWRKYTGISNPSRVSISATNPQVWVALCRGSTPRFCSTVSNSFINWLAVSGSSLPLFVYPAFFYNGFPMDCDKTNGNVFWAYNDDSLNLGSNYGYLYRFDYNPTTLAMSATVVNTGLPKTYDVTRATTLKCLPNGEIWICFYDLGLWKSSDNGANFTKISVFSEAITLDYGKEKPGTTNPAIYVFGTISGVESVWESNDGGSTWTARLNPDPLSIYNSRARGIFQIPTVLIASPNTYGLVVLGTDGHGGFYSTLDLVSTAPIITPPPGGGTISDIVLNLIYP